MNNVISLTLRDVYHVPNIRRNLLSVSQIEMKEKKLIFDNGKVRIINKRTKMIVGEAQNKDGLYVVKTRIVKANSDQVETNMIRNNKISESQIWHQRFCHVNIRNIILRIYRQRI